MSQHQHQHGVPGIDDEEQMITIDSIKSESGVEGLYDERDEEEDEEGFEMTDHGDASGLGVDGNTKMRNNRPSCIASNVIFKPITLFPFRYV